MKKKFTDDDVLRFLYEEMDKSESEEFVDALCKDDTLLEKYDTFESVYKKLDDVSISPSDESCNNILEFVRSTRPCEDEYQNDIQSQPKRKFSLRGALFLSLILFTLAGVGTSMYVNKLKADANKQAQLNEIKTEESSEKEDKDLDQPEILDRTESQPL